MWLLYALLAALSAGIVVTLSKAGIKNIDPSLGFAVQSVLILVVSWSVVLYQKGGKQIAEIEGRTWGFLVAAGIITALSSLFTFAALKNQDSAIVSPIERASLVFAVVFGVVFLKEKLTWQLVVGGSLILGGAILIALSHKSS